MSNKLIRTLLSCSTLGLALTLHSRRAEAAIIGGETPENLALNFVANDLFFLPDGSASMSGPLVPIFSGQYWQVSAADGSRIPILGGIRSFFEFEVKQVVPGKTDLPSASLSVPLFDSNNGEPFIRQASYLASSQPAEPPANFFVNCPLASSDCVFAELQFSRSTNPVLSDDPFIIQAFFQPPASPTPVPESSTVVGSLAALGLIAVLQIKKRFA